MKYIIDIPNADVSRWVAETPLGKKLYIPISVEDGNEYSIATEIYAEEYTEPDRKAVDLQHARDIENVARMNYNEGAKDAWEFARGLLNYTDDDWETITNMLLLDIPYQDAKEKYEAWKKKDEIRIGDEVVYHGNKYVVGYVGADEVYHIVDRNWIRVVIQGDYQIFKTGRHFDEVEELLEKMKEGDHA